MNTILLVTILLGCIILALLSKIRKLEEIETESQFQTAVSGNDETSVFFYAPWCPHCTRIKPRFKQRHRGRRIFVNGDRFPRLLTKYKVEHYPKVVVFKRGQPTGRRVNLEQYLEQ